MRKYALAEERAAKNQKTTVRHFGFTEKVYGLPCTVRTMLWKRHHRNAIVRISLFLPGAIAVELAEDGLPLLVRDKSVQPRIRTGNHILQI